MSEPLKRQPRRPNGAARARQLQVKVPPDLHDAAKAKAAERGETLSAAVVEFLRTYAER